MSYGTLHAYYRDQRMLPTHARILMMIALTKTQDLRELQRIFDQY